MPKKHVLVQGFLVNLDNPTEERLKVRLNLNGTGNIEEFAKELCSLLLTVDEKYAKKPELTKGRNMNVNLTSLRDVEELIKTGRFYPYPMVFVNRLRHLRDKVYKALNRYTNVLSEERTGRSIKKVYFLPAPLAPDLMAEVDQLNLELEELRKEIEAYRQTEDYKKIMEYAGVDGDGFKTEIPDIQVNLVPLVLSREFFRQYLEEQKRRMVEEVEEARKAGLKEVEEAKRKGLQALEKELEEMRQRMLQAIKRDLQNKFATLISLAEKAVKRIVEGKKQVNIEKTFSRIAKLIESSGLEYDERPIEALGRVLDTAKTKDIDALKEAVSQLAESLGVKPTGNPVKDMELTTKTVKGESVLLFTID
jgi:flagellar biosynthesis/type III secretory pathway protein FliH